MDFGDTRRGGNADFPGKPSPEEEGRQAYAGRFGGVTTAEAAEGFRRLAEMLREGLR